MPYFGGTAGSNYIESWASWCAETLHSAKVALPYASQITRVSPCLLSVAVVAVVIMAASYPIALPEAWKYLLREANRTLVHLVISTTSIDI
jgi:hypothetical protein